MGVTRLRVPARPSLSRPHPPVDVASVSAVPIFVPAPDVEAWARATFIDQDSPLANVEHWHLQAASIGFVWTNAVNARHQRRIVGQCEMLPLGGTAGKWAKARAEAQVGAWFPDRSLDFLITLDAVYASTCDDATFCALVEHELLHAGPDLDVTGSPRFRMDGSPKFAMRGHDVEAFVGIAARYGAVEANVKALAEALKAPPSVGRAQLDWACGSCAKAA